jgi:DNA topoisomerase I
MNQYCYKISGDFNDSEELKSKIEKIYSKKKFGELAFSSDEKIPFIVIYDQSENQVCVKLTSKAKKNIERIEAIHKKLKAIDLKINDELSFEKPLLAETAVCEWWANGNNCVDKSSIKWTSLEHNGPYFGHLMQPYEPHKAPLIYDGKTIKLSPEEEKVANFYARRIISEEAGNVIAKLTEDSVFNKNFFEDFKSLLSSENKKIIKVFSKLDFSKIVNKLKEIKENDKTVSDKEKTAKKIALAEKQQAYGFAIINGVKEAVGAYTVEPASLFMGRGNNPKRGKIKRDVEPEQVTINIGKTATIPAPPSGHKWGGIVHDQTAGWLASWKDTLSGENKYVYFAATGQLKSKSDLHKYELGRKLNKFIEKVRKQYIADSQNKTNPKLSQLGTVLYMIDNFGVRVGGEKGADETDTVGASTLRVEHLSLKAPDVIIFDFLGKDSIRFYKELKVEPFIFNNVSKFIKGKPKDAQLFDLISASDINNYLKTFDSEFSAKVFRTRLASTIMDSALKETKIPKNATQDQRKNLFIKANAKVAEVLNHQRTISKKSEESIKKQTLELKELQKELKEAKSDGKKTKTLEEKIKKKKGMIESKKDTQHIAVTTSLTNYIDPRIVVAWAKATETNIPKIYTAVLQKKFAWALNMTEEDWDYSTTPILKGMDKLEPGTGKKPTPSPGVKKAVAKKVPAKAPAKVAAKAPVKAVEKVPSKKAPVKAPAKKVSVKEIVDELVPENIHLVQYTEKSVVLYGDTKILKEKLMELSGKYNPNLTINGKKTPGWIFSNKKSEELQETFGIELQEQAPKAPEEQKAQEKKQEKLSNLHLVKYTDKSIVIHGDTKNLKDKLMQLSGKFNPNLTINGEKTPGWIFSATKKDLLEDTFGLTLITMSSDITPLFRNNKGNLVISKIGDNIIVSGEIMLVQNVLKARGGKFNAKLNGWTFPYARLDEISALFEINTLMQAKDDVDVDVEKVDVDIEKVDVRITFDDLLLKNNTKKFTKKIDNLIKCLAVDKNILKYFRTILPKYVNLIDQDLMAKFVACIETVAQNDYEYNIKYQKYSTMNRQNVIYAMLKLLKPGFITTKLFIILILSEKGTREREMLVEIFINLMAENGGAQKCVCDNKNDGLLLDIDNKVGDYSFKELYLLPSGRCIDLEYLEQHFLKSDNKEIDPTDPSNKDRIWTNGWELNYLIQRLTMRDSDDAPKIEKMFKDILNNVGTVIPQNIKDMIISMAPIFYFENQPDKKTIIDSLVKFGYPNGEKPSVQSATSIVTKYPNITKKEEETLNDFRTLIGFKIYEEIYKLGPKELEAFLFTGEYVGMGREGWKKICTNEFCTKTYGEMITRLAKLFVENGVYSKLK